MKKAESSSMEVRVKSGAATLETSSAVSQTAEHKSTKWSRTSTPRFPTKRNGNLGPRKFLYEKVHSSVLHNNPKLEIIQMTLS